MPVAVQRFAFLVAALAAATLCVSGGADARQGAQATLTVSVTGNGRVQGPGIDCGLGNTNCSETYTAGVGVTLTETPGTGASFSTWGGACSGSGTTCTLTMTADQAVSATFSGGTQTLTLDVNGNGVVTGPGIACGNGSTDCSETYASGAAVTLTETPASGATFSGWGGACSGNASTCSFTMNSNKGVTAAFAGGSTATLTVGVSGNGTVTGPGIACGNGATDCSETYATGTSVTLTESPAAGATFAGWGGVCSGSGSACTVTLGSSAAVSATFTGTAPAATLVVTVTGHGLVAGPGIACGLGNTDCSETYPAGTSVQLTEFPAADSTFQGWAQVTPPLTGFCGGGVVGTPPATCTVTMDVSKSVTATFATTTLPPVPTGTFAEKIGGPIVIRAGAGWNASFHFFTQRAASAVMAESLNGAGLSTFRFTPRAGDVLVGPFVLTAQGTYLFRLTLTDAVGNVTVLDWSFCAGSCGTLRPTLVFRALGVTAVRTATGWSVRVRFQAGSAGTGTIVMRRAGLTVATGRIAFRTGLVDVALVSHQAGLHTIVLNARTSSGRLLQLSWTIVLR